MIDMLKNITNVNFLPILTIKKGRAATKQHASVMIPERFPQQQAAVASSAPLK